MNNTHSICEFAFSSHVPCLHQIILIANRELMWGVYHLIYYPQNGINLALGQIGALHEFSNFEINMAAKWVPWQSVGRFLGISNCRRWGFHHWLSNRSLIDLWSLDLSLGCRNTGGIFCAIIVFERVYTSLLVRSRVLYNHNVIQFVGDRCVEFIRCIIIFVR